MNSGDEYLAKPSGECCLRGSLHQGEPCGVFETIYSVETYVSRPSDLTRNGNILLYFPDVWGMFPNGLLVMDSFASAGYLTIGLDYFQGDPVWKHRKNRHDTSDPFFDYEAWKLKHMTYANARVPGWVEAVKQTYGKADTKYACVGYCFGAPYVCDQLAQDTVDVGAFAHPAFLKESHFSQINKPLFLSCCETDHTFDAKSRRKAVDILASKDKAYNVQLFSGVEHGFALRGDPNDPYHRWVKEQSLRGIVNWFDFWLSRGRRSTAP